MYIYQRLCRENGEEYFPKKDMRFYECLLGKAELRIYLQEQLRPSWRRLDYFSLVCVSSTDVSDIA